MADQAPQPRFLDDRLAHWAKTNPDGEAIAYLGRSFTWAQFDDRVRRLAGALAERGIGRGDVVAFLDKNHPACVETTIAAASLGAATAIINFRLAGDEMDYVLFLNTVRLGKLFKMIQYCCNNEFSFCGDFFQSEALAQQ